MPKKIFELTKQPPIAPFNDEGIESHYMWNRLLDIITYRNSSSATQQAEFKKVKAQITAANTPPTSAQAVYQQVKHALIKSKSGDGMAADAYDAPAVLQREDFALSKVLPNGACGFKSLGDALVLNSNVLQTILKPLLDANTIKTIHINEALIRDVVMGGLIYWAQHSHGQEALRLYEKVEEYKQNPTKQINDDCFIVFSRLFGINVHRLQINLASNELDQYRPVHSTGDLTDPNRLNVFLMMKTEESGFGHYDTLHLTADSISEKIQGHINSQKQSPTNPHDTYTKIPAELHDLDIAQALKCYTDTHNTPSIIATDITLKQAQIPLLTIPSKLKAIKATFEDWVDSNKAKLTTGNPLENAGLEYNKVIQKLEEINDFIQAALPDPASIDSKRLNELYCQFVILLETHLQEVRSKLVAPQDDDAIDRLERYSQQLQQVSIDSSLLDEKKLTELMQSANTSNASPSSSAPAEASTSSTSTAAPANDRDDDAPVLTSNLYTLPKDHPLKDKPLEFEFFLHKRKWCVTIKLPEGSEQLDVDLKALFNEGIFKAEIDADLLAPVDLINVLGKGKSIRLVPTSPMYRQQQSEGAAADHAPIAAQTPGLWHIIQFIQANHFNSNLQGDVRFPFQMQGPATFEQKVSVNADVPDHDKDTFFADPVFLEQHIDKFWLQLCSNEQKLPLWNYAGLEIQQGRVVINPNFNPAHFRMPAERLATLKIVTKLQVSRVEGLRTIGFAKAFSQQLNPLLKQVQTQTKSAEIVDTAAVVTDFVNAVDSLESGIGDQIDAAAGPDADAIQQKTIEHFNQLVSQANRLISVLRNVVAGMDSNDPLVDTLEILYKKLDDHKSRTASLVEQSVADLPVIEPIVAKQPPAEPTDQGKAKAKVQVPPTAAPTGKGKAKEKVQQPPAEPTTTAQPSSAKPSKVDLIKSKFKYKGDLFKGDPAIDPQWGFMLAKSGKLILYLKNADVYTPAISSKHLAQLAQDIFQSDQNDIAIAQSSCTNLNIDGKKYPCFAIEALSPYERARTAAADGASDLSLQKPGLWHYYWMLQANEWNYDSQALIRLIADYESNFLTAHPVTIDGLIQNGTATGAKDISHAFTNKLSALAKQVANADKTAGKFWTYAGLRIKSTKDGSLRIAYSSTNPATIMPDPAVIAQAKAAPLPAKLASSKSQLEVICTSLPKDYQRFKVSDDELDGAKQWKFHFEDDGKVYLFIDDAGSKDTRRLQGIVTAVFGNKDNLLDPFLGNVQGSAAIEINALSPDQTGKGREGEKQTPGLWHYYCMLKANGCTFNEKEFVKAIFNYQQHVHRDFNNLGAQPELSTATIFDNITVLNKRIAVAVPGGLDLPVNPWNFAGLGVRYDSNADKLIFNIGDFDPAEQIPYEQKKLTAPAKGGQPVPPPKLPPIPARLQGKAARPGGNNGRVGSAPKPGPAVATTTPTTTPTGGNGTSSVPAISGGSNGNGGSTAAPTPPVATNKATLGGKATVPPFDMLEFLGQKIHPLLRAINVVRATYKLAQEFKGTPAVYNAMFADLAAHKANVITAIETVFADPHIKTAHADLVAITDILVGGISGANKVQDLKTLVNRLDGNSDKGWDYLDRMAEGIANYYKHNGYKFDNDSNTMKQLASTASAATPSS